MNNKQFNKKELQLLKTIYENVYLKLPNLQNTKTESFNDFVKSMEQIDRHQLN